MPRLPSDLLPRTSPSSPSSPPANPNQHPLHPLRRLLILVSLLALLLSLLTIDNYHSPPLQTSAYILFSSTFFAMYDLLSYAQSSEEQRGKWPKKWILIGDLAFAVVMQLVFWGFVVESQNSYRGVDMVVMIEMLALGICSCFHAYTFYRQLTEFYKAKWRAGMVERGCARCGYVVDEERALLSRQLPSRVSYMGPSAYCHQAGVLTPAEGSLGSAVEGGGLLEISDCDDGVEREEDVVVDAEEAVVVQKEKKKEKKNCRDAGDVGRTTM